MVKLGPIEISFGKSQEKKAHTFTDEDRRLSMEIRQMKRELEIEKYKADIERIRERARSNRPSIFEQMKEFEEMREYFSGDDVDEDEQKNPMGEIAQMLPLLQSLGVTLPNGSPPSPNPNPQPQIQTQTPQAAIDPTILDEIEKRIPKFIKEGVKNGTIPEAQAQATMTALLQKWKN